MSENQVLVPRMLKEVTFYEDVLVVALVDDEAFVPLRPITEHLGLDWSAQRQRLLRDEVLSRHLSRIVMTGADGRQREMVCLQLEYLPGWLFGVTPSRIKPELSPKLTRYREECFQVLWRAFQADLMQDVSVLSSSNALMQVRDLALAVAQMAEQQIEMEQRLTTRLDRAAKVVGDIQRRLGAVERRMYPSALITDEQAEEVSASVKALAELITSKDSSKNHYQGIFAELYRRFGVSSYKNIRLDQFENVLRFLEEWRQVAREK